MRTTRSRPPGGTAKRALIGFLLLGPLLFAPAVSQAAAGAPRFVGSLPLETADRIVVDERRNEIIAVHGVTSLPLKISVFDAKTLKQRRTRTWDTLWNQGWSTGRPTVYAYDHATRELHLVAYRTQAEQLFTANPILVSIDVTTLEVVAELPLVTVMPPGTRMLGLSIDGDDLFLVGQVAVRAGPFMEAPRAFGVTIVSLDRTTRAVRWGPNLVSGCQSAIFFQDQAKVVRHGDSLYTGCATSSVAVFPTPGVPAIVAMPLEDPAATSVFFLPGSYSLGDVYLDPSADRMLMVGSAPGRPAQAVWIFDLRRELFLGQVAAGDLDLLSAGVNAKTGRLYTGISAQPGEGGLLIGSDRGLEIAQAVAVNLQTSFGVITPYGRRRVIIPMLDDDGRAILNVFDDMLPADTIASGDIVDLSILDTLTSYVPQYAGDVQGFGLRVHQIGGVNGVAQNVVPSNQDYWDSIAGATGLRDGDRDIFFGRIEGARLSESDASARGVSVVVDEGTEADYHTVTGSGVSSEAAECRDFGSGETADAAAGTAVTCARDDGKVTAEATGNLIDIVGVVTVGEATSTATLTKISDEVIVARATAQARNVILGGTVEVGFMSSESAVRTGPKAKATYTRVFRDVTSPAYSCEDDCQATEVAAAITQALGAQLRVAMPAVELMTTPKGHHAHAFRDRWAHQQDVVTNNQGLTQLEVPALRITYIGDNAVASRMRFDIAATKADVTSLRVVAPDVTIVPGPPLVPTEGIGRIPSVIETVVSGGGGGSGTGSTSVGGSSIVSIPGHGWRFIARVGSFSAVRVGLLWGLLLSPAFLAMRRRSLARVLQIGR